MMQRKGIAYHGGPDCQYPEFVSVHEHGEHVCLTVRGKQVRNDAKGCNLPGPLAGVKMSWAEFDKFVADIGGYKRST